MLELLGQFADRIIQVNFVSYNSKASLDPRLSKLVPSTKQQGTNRTCRTTYRMEKLFELELRVAITLGQCDSLAICFGIFQLFNLVSITKLYEMVLVGLLQGM